MALVYQFEEIAPRGADYRHHLRWGDDNGSSHVRAALLGPSLTVPFADHKLLLGTWQQIMLLELDTRPRHDVTALRHHVDEVVCAHTPEPFYAVGSWYEDFSQTSDAEVRKLLQQASHEHVT